MNNKIKTYTVADGDVDVIHGKAIVDNEKLMNDFGLSEEESLHNEGDVFNNTDDAALAFGLVYYDISREERQEYGAAIDKVTGGYTFVNVTNSMAKVGAVFYPSELNDKQRREVEIERTKNTVSTIHTHWDDNGNLNFSSSDYQNEKKQISSIYLVNSRFEFIKSVRYSGQDNIYGFSRGIKVF